jgi:hypothetical protein
MKRWLFPVGTAVVVTIGVLLVNDRARTAEPAKPVQWEYRVLFSTDLAKMGGLKDGESATQLHVERGLDKLGADGWELVDASGSGPLATRFHYLKRPKAR